MRWMAAVAIGALALGGCRVSQANEQADGAANEAAAMTPESGTSLAKLFGGGKPMPIDQQVQAANGSVFQLTSFQAKPTETVIGVKVINGADRDIVLQWSDQKTFLVAGGQKFFLSPPLEDRKMRIVKGSAMQGDLVFLGRLPKGQPITLVFNDSMSNSEYSSDPNVVIPLKVSDAGFTDDGSKKN